MDETQLLRTCRKLFLRGHVLEVHIGIHDFEQGAPTADDTAFIVIAGNDTPLL